MDSEKHAYSESECWAQQLACTKPTMSGNTQQNDELKTDLKDYTIGMT